MMFTNEEKSEFIACDNFEKFQLFIEKYDLNKFDNFGSTILHYYLKNLKSFNLNANQVIYEMIKKGLNINAQSSKGSFRHTALNIAVQQNLKEVFELLVDSGADVNLTVANGNSVLLNAVMWSKGDGYFIEKLVERGADVYRKNDYGVSPISLAFGIANYDLKKYFANFSYTPD